MIIGFVGEMRSGKTLLMSKHLKEGYDEGKEILSNYKLNFPHEIVTPDIFFHAIKNKDTKQFENKNIGIDEVHLFLDARNSSSKKNRILSYFVTQSGKLNSTMYWTSQYMAQVDKRLKLNTQIIYKIKRFVYGRKKNKIFLRQDDKREDFHLEVTMHRLAELRHTMAFVPVERKIVLNPKIYFGLYDTTETIFTDDESFETDKKKSKKDKEEIEVL